MKLLLKIIILIFISFSSIAQEFKTENYFENGTIKTTEKVLDDNQIEQIHYFPNGKIRSKGIIKDDIYKTYKGFDEDGTLLASIAMTKDQDRELYTINKFHTNGKPLQNLTYVKDNYLVYTYLPTGVWTSYNSNGQLIEEVTYNPKLKRVDCFKTGTSYYNDGSKKVILSFNSKTNKFTFEQFYPSGKTYLKAIFDYYIFLGNYDDYVEKSKLLNLLRSPGLINNYFYKKDNAITFYKYSYSNGNPAFFKKEDLIKAYRLDGTVYNSGDENYKPKLSGYTICSPDSNQSDCKAFYAKTKQERLDYIPEAGQYIVTADNIIKYTRVYDFSINSTGTLTYYGVNNTVLKTMTYKAGKLNGLYTSRHAFSGEITSEGQYLNGEKEGLFKECSELGELELVQNYTKGLKDGLSQYSGTVGDYWTTSFKSDVKNGQTMLNSTFTNEVLITGAYKNDMKDGRWKTYNFNFERNYPNSVLDYGVNFEFFENDNLTSKIIYY